MFEFQIRKAKITQQSSQWRRYDSFSSAELFNRNARA